jgi:PAS domain S-box-containing protein
MIGPLIKAVDFDIVMQTIHALDSYMTIPSLTVLLTDDSSDDRMAFRQYLLRDTSTQYTIIEAASGAEALAILEHEKPDCILLDYYLPDISGLELMSEMNRRYGSAIGAVIMLTGSGNEQVAVEAMKRGIQDYLTKGSVSAEMLRHAIQNAIARVQLQRQIDRQSDEIARREREFTTLVEHAPDVIARFDVNYRHVYVNPIVERISGLPPEAFIGKTHRELGMNEELCAAWEAHLAAVFASGEAAMFSYTYQSPYGPREYQTRLALEQDGSSSSMAAIAISRDVTEQRRAEARLKFLADASDILGSSMTQEETLPRLADLIVSTLADVCIITLRDHDGGIDHVAVAQYRASAGNFIDAFNQFALYEQAPQAGPAHVLASGRAERWLKDADSEQPALPYAPEQLDRLARMKFICTLTVPLAVGDKVFGTIFLAQRESIYCFEPDDYVLAEELGRRISLSLEHGRLYQDAQQGIYEREAFLSIASHELRNPLTTMLGRAQLLLRRAAKDAMLSERDQRDIHVIVDQAMRVNSMLNDLLDVSRLGAGQFVMEFEPLDVAALLAHVVADLQLTLQQHTLDVNSDDSPLLVNGDAGRLEQVFRNLLSNAVKYSPQGGSIRVAAQHAAQNVVVRISDSGIGIPAEALPHLFQRFYRVPGSSRHASGSGIGLYVVKEIVQRHHGSISVTSEPGGGSTFTVELPLAS